MAAIGMKGLSVWQAFACAAAFLLSIHLPCVRQLLCKLKLINKQANPGPNTTWLHHFVPAAPGLHMKLCLQGLPGCLPWGVMQTYINDYLHLNKGLTVELATVVVLLFGIGCGVGVIAGGAAGQLLYNW